MPTSRNPKRQKGLATVIVTKPSYLQNDGLLRDGQDLNLSSHAKWACYHYTKIHSVGLFAFDLVHHDFNYTLIVGGV